MKKTITFTIALIAIITALTACGAAKESSLPTSSVVEEKPQATTSVTTTAQTTTTKPKPAETSATTAETTTTAETVAETTAPKPIETTAETKAETTAATVAKTEPVQAWTETAHKATMYVTESCNSRKDAVIGATAVKSYSVNTKVSVTAKTDTGYCKLSDGTYIHSDYLSTDKVKTTTTTTAKPKPVETTTQKVNFTVVTTKDDVPLYDSSDCENPNTWKPTKGSEETIVEVIESKKCYKTSEGYYVKMSDVKKGSIDKMYKTLDIKAIRQYLIDDAVNNYGLVLDEKIKKDESSWFPPLVLYEGLNPNVIRMNVIGTVKPNFEGGYMQKGDHINIYVQEITNDKDWGKVDENGKLVKAYAIFFLR